MHEDSEWLRVTVRGLFIAALVAGAYATGYTRGVEGVDWAARPASFMPDEPSLASPACHGDASIGDCQAEAHAQFIAREDGEDLDAF